MTRLEKIKNMDAEEIAKKIIGLEVIDSYCKSTCDEEELGRVGCTADKELKCCIEWLQEELDGK